MKGLPDLKRALAASLGSLDATPADAMRSTLADTGGAPERAVDLVMTTQREAVAAALAASEARAAIGAAVTVLRGVNRIQVFGIGPSDALARYIAAILGRAGRHARALDASGIGLADQLLDVRLGEGLLVPAYGLRP
jgi:DNA-binding MurR/RpiR family transcriptional regulator